MGRRRAVIVAVVVAVVVAGLVGVVVGGGGGADLLLEAREGDAVDADVAVHPDVAAIGLAVALEDEVGDACVRPEVARVADLHAGILLRELLALLPDALLEDAGEQEVGEDGDLLRPKLPQAFEALADLRGGHAYEGGLDHAIRASLVEEARGLEQVRVRVRVGGAPPDDEDGPVFFFVLGDYGGDTLVH